MGLVARHQNYYLLLICSFNSCSCDANPTFATGLPSSGMAVEVSGRVFSVTGNRLLIEVSTTRPRNWSPVVRFEG
jgi:hypothetical protein